MDVGSVVGVGVMTFFTSVGVGVLVGNGVGGGVGVDVGVIALLRAVVIGVGVIFLTTVKWFFDFLTIVVLAPKTVGEEKAPRSKKESEIILKVTRGKTKGNAFRITRYTTGNYLSCQPKFYTSISGPIIN